MAFGTLGGKVVESGSRINFAGRLMACMSGSGELSLPFMLPCSNFPVIGIGAVCVNMWYQLVGGTHDDLLPLSSGTGGLYKSSVAGSSVNCHTE